MRRLLPALLALVCFGLPVGLLVSAGPLAGQAPLEPTGPFGALLAGIDGADPSVHAFGGVGGGTMLHRWGGAEGIGLAGRGAGHSSVLLGAGPSLRLVASPRGELRAWAGVGWYREALTGGVEADPRSLVAAVGGLSGRVPLGPVHVAAGIVHWRGRLDADGFVSRPVASAWRFMVGVGR
jgi:hypothetical protein